MEKKCLFCGIASGEVPAQRVYEDDEVLVFKDVNPQAPVHLLAIPKEHVSSSADVKDPALWSKLMGCAVETAHRLGLDDEGYRLVINCGTRAGQTVFHLHVHLMAGRSFHWPPG
ncbi:MAG TPA: histidine triad nucleotide-binding protein [Synergistaceae bacterium]|nr:histidine triad nucleotide-binding protein [Synergistaceae bacterium]